jgi:hypothetical protein
MDTSALCMTGETGTPDLAVADGIAEQASQENSCPNEVIAVSVDSLSDVHRPNDVDLGLGVYWCTGHLRLDHFYPMLAVRFVDIPLCGVRNDLVVVCLESPAMLASPVFVQLKLSHPCSPCLTG